jgi:hypothetical protein
MEELLFDYENVCQDEELMEEAEYQLYKGIFDKLTRQNDRENKYKIHNLFRQGNLHPCGGGGIAYSPF